MPRNQTTLVAAALLAALTTLPARAQGDFAVTAKVAELADQLVAGFGKLEQKGRFRTIAVLYFEEADEAAKAKKMGRLVGELLGANLAARPDFVVVERERLKQVVMELKLADSGLVDEDSAAQLGKFLGCQAIVIGSVMAAGTDFVVSAQQVAVESSKVLVATQINIPREGLIALSDKAIVTRTTGGAVLRSALIPGWGQIYNEDNAKGALFMSAAIGVAAGAAVGLSLRMFYASEYDGADNSDDAKDFRSSADSAALAANIMAGVYGVVWVLSMLDAWLSGGNYEGVDLDVVEGLTPTVAAGGGAGVLYGLRF